MKSVSKEIMNCVTSDVDTGCETTTMINEPIMTPDEQRMALKRDVARIARELAWHVVGHAGPAAKAQLTRRRDEEARRQASEDDKRVADEWKIVSVFCELVDSTVKIKRDTFRSYIESITSNAGFDISHCDEYMSNMAEKMFNDNRCNWGRIVVLYAFAAEFSRFVTIARSSTLLAKIAIAQNIGRAVGEFVARNLSDWIAEKGGWMSMTNLPLTTTTSSLSLRRWMVLDTIISDIGFVAIAWLVYKSVVTWARFSRHLYATIASRLSNDVGGS